MEDQSALESDTERTARVYQSWRIARSHLARNVVWEYWKFETVHLFVIMAILFNLPDLENPLWGSRQLHWFLQITLAHHFPTGIGIGLIALLPINSLLLESYLNRRTSRLHLVRTEIRWLRVLLSALPILGLYVVPCWKWLVQEHPGWIYRSASDEHAISLAARYAGKPVWLLSVESRLQRIQSLPFFILWFGSLNMVMVSLAVSDLSASEWPTAPRRRLICGLLHLLGFAYTILYLENKKVKIEVSRWRLNLARLATAFWLLPSPLCLGAILVLNVDQSGPGTVVGAAGADPDGFGESKKQVADYWHEKPAWKRWWALGGLKKQQETLASEHRLAAFCRKKTFLTFLDSMALTIVWVGSAQENVLGWICVLVVAVLLVTSLSVTVWMVFKAALGNLIRLIRLESIKGERFDPASSYLLLTQSAFLGGSMLGLALVLGQLGWVVLTLLLIGFSCMLGNFIEGLGITEWKSWKVRVGWIVVFSLFYALAAVMSRSLEGLYGGIGLLYGAAFGVPVWAWILGRSSAAVALHPVSWERAFDDGTPTEDQNTMLLILLTAWLPLGGLTIPLWFKNLENLKSRTGY